MSGTAGHWLGLTLLQPPFNYQMVCPGVQPNYQPLTRGICSLLVRHRTPTVSLPTSPKPLDETYGYMEF
jgi:hypothetical protein